LEDVFGQIARQGVWLGESLDAVIPYYTFDKSSFLL
jgi:hypothetical protein